MNLLDRIQFWRSEPGTQEYHAVTEHERLIGKESDQTDIRYQRLQQAQRRLKRWVIDLSILLGLAVLLLLLAIGSAAYRYTNESEQRSPVPPIPSTRVTFDRDDLFAGPSTEEREQAWSALMSPSDGFILLPNTTAQPLYNLPLGKPTLLGQVYDISLFHQMHCLANIRKQLFLLQATLNRDDREETYEMLLRPQEDHVFHCFDYIRQALMCAGDMTVEWLRTAEDGRRFAVDGWGITHECRSWMSLDLLRDHPVLFSAF